MNKYFKLENYKVKFKEMFGKNYSITYAQNGEDIIIWNLCRSLHIEKPSYIDIGAFHPKNLSNTYFLYTHGCTGINIEPNKDTLSFFKKIRPKDMNLSLAISNTTGQAEYFVMDTPTLNTLSKQEAESYIGKGHKILHSYPVETMRLDDAIKNYCNNIYPDILCIDTEGYDMKILQTIDWSIGKPKIICVETAEYNRAYANKKNKELISWIEDRGYIIHADTYINTIFVDKNI